MRAFAFGVLAALALVVSGCGSSSTGTTHGGTLGGDAAKLVPANAAAFVSVDSDLNSPQWQAVDSLAKTLTNGKSIVEEITSKLRSKGLSWSSDVAPALGSEVDVAVLKTAAEPEIVAFTQPHDQGKLNALVAKLGTDYSVQQIGGWSVVSDSQDTFGAVRAAQSGLSLADSATFHMAWSSLAGNALAQAYVNPSASSETGTHPDWIAAQVRVDSNAVRIDAIVKPHGAAPPAITGASLLGDVPSGAALAIAFHSSADLTSKLSSLTLPKGFAATLPIKRLAPLLAGGGVVYARPSGLVPDIAVELAPKDPQAALATVKPLLRSLGAKLGPLQLFAQVSGGRLVIADSPGAASALRGGAKLVDDAAFKDALSKAGAPAQSSFLAYADVSQLAPFVPVALQALTGKAPDPELSTTLSHIGNVVAWAARSGGRIELHVWAQTR
jgi:hypothetical protein